MSNMSRLEFMLLATDFFRGSYEIPVDQGGWGNITRQMLTGLAIHDLANGIQNAALREQIHAAANKVIVESSQLVAKQ